MRLLKRPVVCRLVMAVVALPLLVSSCKDEDEKPDMATQISGTYDYESKLYMDTGTDVEYLGSSFDESGTAVVSKTSTGIEMKEDDEVRFRGTKLTQVERGIVFDLETVTFTVDNQEVEVSGYEGVDVDGVSYDGAYETATKELTAYMQFEGVWTEADGSSYEATFIIEITGTKK